MYLCQQLEQMSDRRYRRDWRVVWYKVVLTPENILVWHRQAVGKWRGHYRRRDRLTGLMRLTLASDRAKKDFMKNVPVWQSVRHGSKVTGKQAEPLTNIRNPFGLDRLMEAGDELTMPELCNYVFKKPEPTKAELVTKRLEAARLRVEAWDRKIARSERTVAKWKQHVARLEKRLEKLSVPNS